MEWIQRKKPLRGWCRSGCGKLDGVTGGGGGEASAGGERIVTVFLLLTPHSAMEVESSSWSCITPVIALSTCNSNQSSH